MCKQARKETKSNKQINKQRSKPTNKQKPTKKQASKQGNAIEKLSFKTFFLFQKLLLHNFLKNFHQTLFHRNIF